MARCEFCKGNILSRMRNVDVEARRHYADRRPGAAGLMNSCKFSVRGGYAFRGNWEEHGEHCGATARDDYVLRGSETTKTSLAL